MNSNQLLPDGIVSQTKRDLMVKKWIVELELGNNRIIGKNNNLI